MGKIMQDYSQEILDGLQLPDPSDQTLLKGCAQLAASIHHRLDRERGSQSKQILAQLCPGMVEDIPAYTMAQYERRGAREGFIPRGDTVSSGSIVFKTSHALEVHDFMITTCLSPSERELVLTILVPKSMAGQPCTGLPLYIDMPYDKASFCYFMMRYHLKSGFAAYADTNIKIHCEPAPSTYQETLADPLDSGFMAYQYLVDYFSWVQKYLMVSIIPEGPQPWILKTGVMTLTLSFNKAWPARYIPKPSDLKFSCVPLVNRYEYECEPITVDHRHYRYPLIVDRQSEDLELLSVHSVQGKVQKTGEVIHYHHIRQGVSPYYAQEGRYISCQGGTLSPHILSVSAWVCNADLPHRTMEAGPLLRKPGAEMKAFALQRPTRRIKRVGDIEYHTLFNHGLVTIQALQSGEQLRFLLTHLNVHEDSSYAKRIAGIGSLHSAVKLMMRKGEVRYERVLTLTLKQDHYGGMHDLYLFGTVLHIFFSYHAAQSEVVSLVVNVFPTAEVLVWKPLYRTNTLISLRN